MADPLIHEDDDYASSEDSDFAPEDAPPQDSDQSGSEADDNSDRPNKKRRTTEVNANEDDDAGYENSGDEAIIKKGEARKQRRRERLGADAKDEGGEGGLIKTRRQKAQEKEERRVAKATGPVTIDVDAVWAQMLAGKPPKPPTDETTTVAAEEAEAEAEAEPEPAPSNPNDTILIKRTYTFAGKTHTEEKLVPRSSAEAKLYLSQNPEPALDAIPAKRTTKKAFRSRFEPLSEATPQRADLNLSVQARRDAAKKLNVVEKSRMDWAGYVDKEGIKDELELAGRSKQSYNAREEFLARSEARREDDARRARLAGRA